MLLSFFSPILSVTNFFAPFLLCFSLSPCRMPSLWKKEGSSCKATFAWWWTNWSRHCRSSQLAPPKRPCCLCCLSVCKWTHTGVFSIWHLGFCVVACGSERFREKGCQHTCRARYRPPVCERLIERLRDVSGEIHAGLFVMEGKKSRNVNVFVT